MAVDYALELQRGKVVNARVQPPATGFAIRPIRAHKPVYQHDVDDGGGGDKETPRVGDWFGVVEVCGCRR